MENIYTIPVNEAFEESMSDPACGCPFCRLFNKYEDNELELILGASMMEPDIRIMTNKEGFCSTHYDMMLLRKNRLGMALTLQSHLAEISKDIKDRPLSKPGEPAIKRIGALECSCYVCRRVEFNFSRTIETAVILWDNDEAFPKKLEAQPYFCLPHYRRMLEYASKRLGKKQYAIFESTVSAIQNSYLQKLSDDIGWFCKKFDYRYDSEPWYDSKDSIERSVKFLRGELHKPVQKRKPLFE